MPSILWQIHTLIGIINITLYYISSILDAAVTCDDYNNNNKWKRFGNRELLLRRFIA